MNEFPYMFSVAVITYNQKDTIRDTLDHILNQKHDYKYEIVIGDDCSSDGTAEIIEEYRQKYPEIIHPIFNNPNLGAMKNYYNVLNHCQGKYVMDCAGDDYWLDGKVKTQIEIMEADPSIYVTYGKVYLYNETKKTFRKIHGGNGRCSFEQILFVGNPIPSLTSCVRGDKLREYLDTVRPLDQGWALEDLPMWLYMSKYGKLYFINKDLGVYRIQEESVSHSQNEEKLIRLRESQYAVREYFVQDDPKLKKKVGYVYYQIMAGQAISANDLPKFRKLASQSKNPKYAVLKWISYLPNTSGLIRTILGV